MPEAGCCFKRINFSKKMRTTFLYILLFAVLGTLAWYFLIREDDSVFSSAEAGFTIKDTGAISKIFLSNREGSLTLTRTNSGWRVNDKYPVLPASLATLFQALYGQYAIGPVSQAAHNNVVHALSASSTKAEIYGKNGQKIRTFFVGNEAHDFNNTYMLMEGAQRPYIVGLRGFEGFLTPRYSTKLSDWRDRTVFDIDPGQIRSVELTYPHVPENSFVITATGNGLRISPPIPGATADPGRLRDYLQFFRNINAEGYVNGTDGIDSLIANAPRYATIKVTTDKGSHTAELYFMAATQRTGFDASVTIDDQMYDSERQYAVLDRQDTLLVQEMIFSKILQPRRIFFPQATADTLRK